MGLLAKKGGGDEEKDPSGTSLDMERKHCPTCRRELPPWREECPDDGARLVALSEMPSDDGPAIPPHLLAGLDDEPAPGEQG
jgi:hypothetical protein